MTKSHLPPNGEWRVGDVVEAFGVRGRVSFIAKLTEEYPVTVIFFNGKHHEFCEDGKFLGWHALPSLRFISREKKKVKKTVTRWVNVFIPETHEAVWRRKEDADTCCKDRIACVELKGEYEIEE